MSNDKNTNNPENILGYMQDHIRRYLSTDGADGHLENGLPCLVMTTLGKKTGEPRQAAMIYGEDNGRFVVIGSKGGSDTPPAWFVNLMATGGGFIQVANQRYCVRASIAEGAEREQLWQKMSAIFPMYLEYQQKTERLLPVVILQPV